LSARRPAASESGSPDAGGDSDRAGAADVLTVSCEKADAVTARRARRLLDNALVCYLLPCASARNVTHLSIWKRYNVMDGSMCGWNAHPDR